MKILFCIGTFGKGGAERVLGNLANYMINENEIKIVSLVKGEKAYRLDSRIEFEFLDKKVVYKKNFISKIFKNINRIIKLNKIIKQFKPSVIVTFIPEPSFLVLMLKRIHNIKTIVSVRNDPKKEYESKLYNIFMKKLYPKADGFVFQTKEAKNYFKNIINCPSKVIANPINQDFSVTPFDGIRKKIIVNVGRLQEQKNQQLLIKAFSQLPDKYKDYKLIIYGEGPLRNELESLILKLNLQNRVLLPGIEDNIKEKIYDSSLFVLSSEYEGMPNALMEAMALGLPVISTDCPCGGPRFLISNNENGVLIECNDCSAMTNAILKIISNQKFAKKLSKNANKINVTLSPDLINEKWYEFIKEIGGKENQYEEVVKRKKYR